LPAKQCNLLCVLLCATIIVHFTHYSLQAFLTSELGSASLGVGADFIANRTCNTTVTGSFCIRYSLIWHDPVIFPMIGPSVLNAANQNA